MINLSTLRHFIYRIEMLDSIIGIVGVFFIVGAALSFQFIYKEKPCPLCLLQRVALINMGLALLLNLRHGNRAWHWGLVILNSAAGISVSVRQMFLHITSSEGFGLVLLGLHMYTWCAIVFGVGIIGSAFMLLIYPERTFNME